MKGRVLSTVCAQLNKWTINAALLLKEVEIIELSYNIYPPSHFLADLGTWATKHIKKYQIQNCLLAQAVFCAGSSFINFIHIPMESGKANFFIWLGRYYVNHEHTEQCPCNASCTYRAMPL